jgi:hypothetical protein
MSKPFIAAVLIAVLAAWAAAQVPDEAAYTADITKRANDVIKVLSIDDTAKADRIREILISQYRALRDWHDANDAKLKDKSATAEEKERIAATLNPVHDEFLSKLSAELAPEQVEKVKDKVTYNVVQVTYIAYCDELPQLTDAQKAYILAQLKEAREIAMDQGSSNEKHAVFGKYKGRINNYLAKEGYDLKKAEKEWAQRRKARATSQSTQQEAK